MANQTNGLVLKVTIGATVTLLLFTVASVWRAARYVSSVDANCNEINAIKPVVHANEIAIELFRRDIEQILIAQNKMILREEENTKRIIEAIKNGN